MKTRIIAVAAVLLFAPFSLLAQCSDAGACSIGAMGPGRQHYLSARYAFGRSGKIDDLTIHTIEMEAIFSLFSRSRLMVLMPWSRVAGPAGNVSGPGDLTVLWHQPIVETDNGHLAGQIGFKLATGTADGSGLPQAYQPGLGTNDLLIGAAYESGPWLFAAGYQLSGGRSDNALTRLKRGDDVMARAGYNTSIGDLGAGIELLAIKRLHTSSVLAAGTNTFVDVPGSDQFQMNLVPALSLPVSARVTLHGAAGIPLLKRDVNVDGLTRSLTLLIGIRTSW